MESLNVNKHWISPTTGSVSCLSFELALSMMDNCFFHFALLTTLRRYAIPIL